jgi:photosystem II stability/assembly factor-like uncharacterized protein
VLAALTVFVLLVLGAPRDARANGAFPESYQLILPVDQPRQIYLATNFGLIISDDEGASWSWTCEQKETVNASLYAITAPPLDRLLSLSSLAGLAYSDDGSCTWASSEGSLANVLASDYFPDPTNAMRVYAMGKDPNDDNAVPQVFPSDDGGKTFGAAIFTAAANLQLAGLENARTDPKTIYLAAFTNDFKPRLERSTDGGATWQEFDVEASLGTNNFRIIAVDPNDASTLTVRVIEKDGESLAISHDSGQTFTKVATIAGQFTGYARMDSGTIVVSGALVTEGVGFRSTDGGKTFTDWTPRTESDAGVLDMGADGGAPRPPHIRALAARGGKLYAAAKNFSDDWAVGVSTDEGVTFQRLTRYDEVKSILACAQQACRDSCDYQAGLQIWPPAVCSVNDPDAELPPEQPTPVPEPPAAATGCGCTTGGAFGPAGLAGAIAAVVLLVGRGRPRARRSRR